MSKNVFFLRHLGGYFFIVLVMFSACNSKSESSENEITSEFQYENEDVKITSDDSEKVVVIESDGVTSTYNNEGIWPTDLPNKLAMPAFANVLGFVKEEKKGETSWIINIDMEEDDYKLYHEYFKKAGLNSKVNEVAGIVLGVSAKGENIEISLITGVLQIKQTL